jgi:hypothetical protein
MAKGVRKDGKRTRGTRAGDVILEKATKRGTAYDRPHVVAVIENRTFEVNGVKKRVDVIIFTDGGWIFNTQLSNGDYRIMNTEEPRVYQT